MKPSTLNRGLWPSRAVLERATPFSNWFDEAWGGFGGFTPTPKSTKGPALNVAETEGSYRVEASVPGYSIDDLDVSVEGRTLRISGEKVETSEENVSYHRRERFAASFERSIELPTAIDSSRVTAELKHGILLIELPKPEEVQPRRIEVRK